MYIWKARSNDKGGDDDGKEYQLNDQNHQRDGKNNIFYPRIKDKERMFGMFGGKQVHPMMKLKTIILLIMMILPVLIDARLGKLEVKGNAMLNIEKSFEIYIDNQKVTIKKDYTFEICDLQDRAEKVIITTYGTPLENYDCTIELIAISEIEIKLICTPKAQDKNIPYSTQNEFPYDNKMKNTVTQKETNHGTVEKIKSISKGQKIEVSKAFEALDNNLYNVSLSAGDTLVVIDEEFDFIEVKKETDGQHLYIEKADIEKNLKLINGEKSKKTLEVKNIDAIKYKQMKPEKQFVSKQKSGRVEIWFSRNDKQFGYIKPDEGGENIWVHKNYIVDGHQDLKKNDLVTYNVGQSASGDGKYFAKNVRVYAYGNIRNRLFDQYNPLETKHLSSGLSTEITKTQRSDDLKQVETSKNIKGWLINTPKKNFINIKKDWVIKAHNTFISKNDYQLLHWKIKNEIIKGQEYELDRMDKYPIFKKDDYTEHDLKIFVLKKKNASEYISVFQNEVFKDTGELSENFQEVITDTENFQTIRSDSEELYRDNEQLSPKKMI